MQLNRVWAISRKEFLQILRDWRSLLMTILTPLILLVLFGYALSFDVEHVPLVVLDHDETPESRDLIAHFVGSPYFDLKKSLNKESEIDPIIEKRLASVALVIPTDYAENIQRLKPSKVQIILDGADANTATISLGYAEALVRQAANSIRKSSPALDIRNRIWFNPNARSQYNIIPGLIAIIIMINAALMTALTISREWERGTMEQLIASPIKTSELLTGKLIPYFVIGILDLIIVVVLGEFLFSSPHVWKFCFAIYYWYNFSTWRLKSRTVNQY